MHCLRRSNADQDSQDFDTRRSLRHGGIKTVSSLLDGRKVKCRSVCWVASPTSARKLVVLDSSKFVVLYPKIGLQDFSRCCEPKQGGVAPNKTAAVFFRSPFR